MLIKLPEAKSDTRSNSAVAEIIQVLDRGSGAWTRTQALLNIEAEYSYITLSMIERLGLTPMPLLPNQLTVHDTELGTFIPTHDVYVEIRPLERFSSRLASSEFITSMLVVDQPEPLLAELVLGRRVVELHFDGKDGSLDGQVLGVFADEIESGPECEADADNSTFDDARGEFVRWVAKISSVSSKSRLGQWPSHWSNFPPPPEFHLLENNMATTPSTTAGSSTPKSTES